MAMRRSRTGLVSQAQSLSHDALTGQQCQSRAMNLIVALVFGVAASAAAEGLSAGTPQASVMPGEGQDKQTAALVDMMHAVNAGEADRYARLYAQDAVITIYGSGVLEGRGAIEKHEVDLLREFPGARLGFYDVWQKGSLAVVRYAVNGRTPGGESMGHEGLLFYRFRSSGLIEEEHRYLDSLTPMAQLGALGPLPARPLPTLPSEMKTHVARGSPDEDENVALVRANLVALESKDKTAFFSSLAEDAVLDEMIDPRPFIGKRNLNSWFERWTGAVPDARSEISTILGVGEFVLVETVVRGTLKGPLGPLSASASAFAVHRAAIVEVKDGKISRISIFMNLKELAQAVGQWPLVVGK